MDCQTMEDLDDVFRKRQLDGIKMKKINIQYHEKRIAKLNDLKCNWTQEDTRQKLIDEANKYFDTEIRDAK